MDEGKPSPSHKDLKKDLTLLHVFCIAAGAMISSGLFILPGMAHAIAGPGVVFSYLIGGLLATAGAFSIAELTTAMPKAGGDYFFISRGLGPGVGTVAGTLSWFSLSLKSAFAIVGMGAFAVLIVQIHGVLIGAGLTFVFVIINILGVKKAATTQVVLVLGLLGLLALYVVAGLPRLDAQRLLPIAPYGIDRIFFAAGFVFVAYAGLLNIASVAEEVKNPGRNIPRGILLALGVLTLIYTLVVMITAGVLDPQTLDGSLTPISDGAEAVLGPFGFLALSLGAILAFISTANAGMMTASRYLLALSRDGLLPPQLSTINRRFSTPHLAIGITGAVVTLSLFLPLEILVEAASTVLILANVLACLSVIILRESHLQNYRPAFRSPLYPWIQVLTIIGLGYVLVQMGPEAYLISALLILISFLIYWLYGKQRSMQEPALLNVVERVTSRELVTGSLDNELKQIVRERDHIEIDRFDRAVENGIVLDLNDEMAVDAFVELAAQLLADRLQLEPERLARILKNREKTTNIQVKPGVAVWHAIVPGRKKFELLVARVAKGVSLTHNGHKAHSLFVVVGTADERAFHLNALTAIAQTAQERDYEKRWLGAKNKQAMIDTLLLAKRPRSM